MKKHIIATTILVGIIAITGTVATKQLSIFLKNVDIAGQTAAAGARGGGTITSHFISVGTMQYVRSGHLATRMKDGRVLFVGGINGSIPAEIYNPTTKTFSVAATPLVPEYGWNGSLSTLSDGRVLHAGDGDAEVYDAVTNTWTKVSSTNTALQVPRVIGESLAAANGMGVLIGGRSPVGNQGISSIAIFDPSTNTWSNGGAMVQPRYEQCSVLVSDGRIWTAMGLDSTANGLISTELYDPISKTSTQSASLLQNRDGAWGFPLCTALPNSKALIGGGMAPQRISGAYYDTPIATTEIFDVVSNTVTKGPNMLEPHGHGVATMLPNGSVLVTGGYKLSSKGISQTLTSGEIYNGTSFVSVGKMTTPRQWHTATLLNNGTVLIASDGTAEVYIP